MKIELKKITMENYKCFPNKTADFYHKTRITGRNREGKSTTKDCYFDVMTGKMADGTSPDKIRPHDENGADLNSDDVVREICIEIDGKPVCIRKITAQKWKRKAGKSENVPSGNETTYEIDGFPKKSKEFSEFMEQIARPEILMICSNPAPFLAMMRKSTADARKFIESISGFSEEQFVADNPQYGAVSTILSGHSAEDVMKKLKKQLSEQRRKSESKTTEIKYEKNRRDADGDIDISALELEKNEWKERLKKVNTKLEDLEDVSDSYDEISGEILRLKQARDRLIEKEIQSLSNGRATIMSEINSLQSSKRLMEGKISRNQATLKNLEHEIKQRGARLEEHRKEYKRYLEQEFDETYLRQIEAERFDESSYTCPTCGQVYPEEMREELRERFISAKAERISDEHKARDTFYRIRTERLHEVTQKGNDEKSSLDRAKAALEQTNAEIERLSMETDGISEKIQECEDALAKIPSEKDLSGNSEYQKLSAEIAAQEERLGSLVTDGRVRKDLLKQRDEYIAEISNIDGQIQRAVDFENEKDQNIENLTKELREISQTVANIEKQIDAIGEFSRAKNEALAEKVNQFFQHFKFVFLEYTIDGNPVETCRIISDGTDYMNGLNGGDKKLCEIDLCRGFQAMSGLCLPIWVDEANTIDPDRIPQDLEQQLILISRSDGDLKIEMEG